MNTINYGEQVNADMARALVTEFGALFATNASIITPDMIEDEDCFTAKPFSGGQGLFLELPGGKEAVVVNAAIDSIDGEPIFRLSYAREMKALA